MVHVVGRRVGKGGESEDKGLPMCSVCICALCRGHLCNLLSLMAFNVRRQAEPSQVGPPVVHWPFGRSLKLMQKLFDRFAIRRKNAKQTSGSGGQAMHQSSCQYDNICICVRLSVCPVWPVQGVCIIAVPKLEIYYNFHTSVTRCCRIYIWYYIYTHLYFVAIIFRVSQCHYFDRHDSRGSCCLCDVTSRRQRQKDSA